jgi:hypothetical protein
MVKPKGQQGSWFAKWDGEDLPCVHDHWRTGAIYRDPHVDDRKQWSNFIEALRTGRKAILTKSEVTGPLALRRAGYLSLWTIDDVEAGDGVLTFRFVKKLREFRN